MESKVKVVKSEKSWVETNAIDQLEKTAELDGIVKAVGLPDLHVGKTPVGAAYITKDIIYPHIIGSDIGCGMALFSTGIKRGKFKFDKMFGKLFRLGGLENVDISELIKEVDLPFKESLGTIGAGNHFSEFQEVSEIFSQEDFDKIGMEKGNIYLLVHSGSRGYGEYIIQGCIRKHSCQNGLKLDSEAFNEYWQEHEKAVKYAGLNRELIAYRILNVIGAKENIKLLDSVHNSITKKEIEGEEFYIHRKGAAPSDIGCIVIAGTRSTKSYIIKPEEGLFDYCYSVSHGAGRRWPRFDCKQRLQHVYPDKTLRDRKLASSIICRDKSMIYEEAPEAYKSIERVIEDMLEEKMIKLVASLNPLITYKV
jgi:release factor H-coupled RctB family protein